MKHVYLQQFTNCLSQKLLLKMPAPNSSYCKGRKSPGQDKLKCRNNCVQHCSCWVQRTHDFAATSEMCL